MDFSQVISEYLPPPARTNPIRLRYGPGRGHRQGQMITSIPAREMQRRLPGDMSGRAQAPQHPASPSLPLSTGCPGCRPQGVSRSAGCRSLLQECDPGEGVHTHTPPAFPDTAFQRSCGPSAGTTPTHTGQGGHGAHLPRKRAPDRPCDSLVLHSTGVCLVATRFQWSEVQEAWSSHGRRSKSSSGPGRA